jgi:hypothetical protein
MNFKDAGCEGVDWIRLARERLVVASWQHGNEPSGSIKCVKCFDQLSDYKLLKKYYAPGSLMISSNISQDSTFL